MNFDRSRLKSGFSVAAMIISMSLLASVVGYFLGSWMIQYVTAPEDEIGSVPSEEVILEERISTDEEEEGELDLEGAGLTTDDQELEVEPEETMGQGLYVVQVGAFESEENAQGLVRNLEELGYSAYITSEDPYRVQVGAYEDRQSAQSLGQRLEDDGFPSFISY